MNSLISTKEAAATLKVSVRRVQALIASGRLPAEKIGNSYVIKPSDLKLINGRKSGRPTNGEEPSQEYFNKIIRRLAGKHSFGPPDLSTNKKYMEGFGRD